MGKIAEVNPFYLGCTVAELARLFGINREKVRGMLSHVPYDTTRGPHDVYRIATAAKYLTPPMDAEEIIKKAFKARPDDLPPKLSREFWMAQRAKQQFEIAAGDLWSTDKVVEEMGAIFKSMRLSMQLFTDTLSRRTALTEEQRTIIQQAVDATLENMRRSLVDGFEVRRKAAASRKASEAADSGSEEEL